MSHIVPASFEWKTTGARVSDSVTVVKDLYYGLLFKRGTQALTERDRGAVNPYVCYMILSQVQQIPQVPLGTSEIGIVLIFYQSMSMADNMFYEIVTDTVLYLNLFSFKIHVMRLEQ